MTDSKKNLDEKCWKGYKKKGMKTMFGKRYPNCVKVKKEEFSDWRSEFEQIEEIDYDQVIEGSAGVLKDTIFPKKPKEKRMSASLLDNIRKVNTGAGSQYENVMLTYKSGQGFDAKLGGKSVRNTVKNIKTGVDAVKNIKNEKGIVKGIKKTINDKKTINKTKPSVATNVGDAIKNFKTTISSSYDMIEKMDLKKADMGDVITDFRKSDAPQFKGKSDKKIQKMAIAAKLEADEVKENTAIESELVIQDWNVDEIKYTEVEAVDIIKPEPLKPSPSNWRMDIDEDWQKENRKDKTDGLSQKAVNAYRKENPGSKLKTAVTKDPKKLKKGSKSAKRRLAFCRRMKGMKKKLTSAKTRRDPDSRINKALRRWNC